MKHLHQMVCVLVLLTVTCLVNAELVKTGTLSNLMMISGMEAQIQDISTGIKAGAIAARGKVSSKNHNKVMPFLDELVKPEIIYNEVVNAVSSALSEQQAQSLITWYESSLGRRIVVAGEYSATATGITDMQGLAHTLIANKKLMINAKRLARAGGLIDQGMKTQISLMRTVQIAAMKFAQPSKVVDVESINQALLAQQERMGKLVEQSILVNLAFTFKDFDIDDLETYMTFLQRPAMSIFNKRVIHGTQASFEKATSALAAIIIEN